MKIPQDIISTEARMKELCRQWEALELELFTPQPLPQTRMAVIAAARAHYTEITPTDLAALKPEAEAELMAWAHQQGDRLDDMKHSHPFARAMLSDLLRIQETLFQRQGVTSSFIGSPDALPSNAVEITGGATMQARTAALHCDGARNRALHPAYIMRVGSLPTEYIRHDKLDELQGQTSPDHVTKLLTLAKAGMGGTAARQELRRLGALVPAPLGRLTLFVTSEHSRYPNWHCGSPIPGDEHGSPERTVSAFVRGFGKFRLPDPSAPAG